MPEGTRREFLGLVGGAALGLVAGGRLRAGEAPADPLRLGAPVTHSDWMLREGVAWGPEGVRHMLDTCRAGGWSRVYWRVLDGGRALYASKLLDPQGKWDGDNFWHPRREADRQLTERYTGMSAQARAALLSRLEQYDYAGFDTLAEAVRYGHQVGLQVHAWISINEDDHGWGLQSRFSRAHPQFRWRKRDGTPYRSQLSFAYPQVMAYKLAIVEEIGRGYAVDGLFLDWLRTGDVRDNPQTDAQGVADHGYEEPLVSGFRARYGADPRQLPNGDPRWVRWRAQPHTEFMREVRQRAPGLPVAVLVAHPWCYRGQQDPIDGNLRGLLLDVRTWGRERLVEAAVAAGYYRQGGSAAAACRALRAELGRTAEVWHYAWVPETVAQVQQECALARELGARQVLFWEADYIDGRQNREELQRAMREQAGR